MSPIKIYWSVIRTCRGICSYLSGSNQQQSNSLTWLVPMKPVNLGSDDEDTRTNVGTSASMTTPQPKDVILGRGKSYGKHPGNAIFQDIVQSNRLRYFESSFSVKRAIIAEVMDTIQSSGGRFVRLKDNAWSVAPDEMVRLKTAHAIQYHIRVELSQSRHVLPTTGNDVASVPKQEISDHDRIVKKIREQVSILKSQSPSSAPPTSFRTTGCNEHMRQVSPSTAATIVKPVTARPYHSEFDAIKQSSAPPPSVDGMKQSSRCDSYEQPKHIMPSMEPAAEEEITGSRSVQLNNSDRFQSVPSLNRRTVSESFASDIVDRMQLQQCAPHINLFIEQAIADYIDFTHSPEYRYYFGSTLHDRNVPGTHEPIPYFHNVSTRQHGNMAFNDAADIHRQIPHLHDVLTNPKHSYQSGNTNHLTVPPLAVHERDSTGVWPGLDSFDHAHNTFHQSKGSSSHIVDFASRNVATATQTYVENKLDTNIVSDQYRASASVQRLSPAVPLSVLPQPPPNVMDNAVLEATSDFDDTDDDSVSHWAAKGQMFDAFD